MAKLHFDRFHPLDHWPGSARCRSFYGGWRNHLSLAWWVIWRDRVLRPIRRPLWCPLGRHRWNFSYRNTADGSVQVEPFCTDCAATRAATQQEKDEAIRLPTFE